MSDPRTQPGPMARSVGDLELLLSVAAGSDPRDSGTMPVPLGERIAGLAGRRVLLHLMDGGPPAHDGAEAAVRRAAAALADAGAIVDEGSPPPGGHDLTVKIWRSYGKDMTSADFYRTARAWDIYRNRMLEWSTEAGIDLILTPVATLPAQEPGTEQFWEYLTPYAMTGWPCAVVRAGSSGGLPVGVQLVAGPWRDRLALAAARVVEDATGGWQPPLVTSVIIER